MHPAGGDENDVMLPLQYTVTDGGGHTGSGTLTVDFDDDTPVAVPSVKAVNSSSGGDTNVVLVLDTSGSMGDNVGTNTTRLDVLKASANELLEQYHNLGNVKVEVIQFNSSPSQVGTAWMTVDQAESYIANLTAGGSTNYTSTLTFEPTEFAQAGKIAGANNVSYFISDGVPDNNITTAQENAYINFLQTNHINSFALGAGSGAYPKHA